MNISNEAVQAAHAAICEQNFDDCLEWRGRCVKATEAAAPYLMGRKVTLTRSSLYFTKRGQEATEIAISSIEDLEALIAEHGAGLILSVDEDGKLSQIEVYDDYRR